MRYLPVMLMLVAMPLATSVALYGCARIFASYDIYAGAEDYEIKILIVSLVSLPVLAGTLSSYLSLRAGRKIFANWLVMQRSTSRRRLSVP